jgi:hypothetical protein
MDVAQFGIRMHSIACSVAYLWLQPVLCPEGGFG